MNNPEVDKFLYNASISDDEGDRMHKMALRALKDIVAEELTKRQKQFIVLYYYKGMDMTEIAEVCKVSVSTVSRTISRARKKIADRIKYYFIK